jgi:hypothetical protein
MAFLFDPPARRAMAQFSLQGKAGFGVLASLTDEFL